MDLLTKIARASDGRFEPMPGVKVRVGQFTRLVMERHNNRLAKAIFKNRDPDLDVEILYLEQFRDEGFHPTYHSCSLLEWRAWASRGLGVEVE